MRKRKSYIVFNQIFLLITMYKKIFYKSKFNILIFGYNYEIFAYYVKKKIYYTIFTMDY